MSVRIPTEGIKADRFVEVAKSRYIYPSEHAALNERIYRAVEALFASVGADASFGTQLAGALEAAGFDEVVGGLVTADDLSRFLALSVERTAHYAPPGMASAWGRRPAT